MDGASGAEAIKMVLWGLSLAVFHQVKLAVEGSNRVLVVTVQGKLSSFPMRRNLSLILPKVCQS